MFVLCLFHLSLSPSLPPPLSLFLIHTVSSLSLSLSLSLPPSLPPSLQVLYCHPRLRHTTIFRRLDVMQERPFMLSTNLKTNCSCLRSAGDHSRQIYNALCALCTCMCVCVCVCVCVIVCVYTYVCVCGGGGGGQPGRKRILL